MTPRRFGWDNPNDWLYAAGGLCPYPKTVSSIEKTTHIGKDGFQVNLDVQHFTPDEISVKTIDNTIVIVAKHEERQDEHGYIARQFQRRYRLPKGFNVKDVASSISADGILTVKAPPATPSLEGNVRLVQIQQTGPARSPIPNESEKSKTKAQ